MSVARDCNACGRTQMIGHNAVDGRVMWWTPCNACGKGNFMAAPDPRVVSAVVNALATQRSPVGGES